MNAADRRALFRAELDRAHATPPEYRRVRCTEVRQLGAVLLIRGIDLSNGEDVVALPGTRMAATIAAAIVERGEQPTVAFPGYACLSLDAYPPEPEPVHDWDAASAIRGQGMAEYALLLALISVVAVVALLFLGGAISATLANVAASVQWAASAVPSAAP
jgi:Flp pilus assembly pilin Flp